MRKTTYFLLAAFLLPATPLRGLGEGVGTSVNDAAGPIPAATAEPGESSREKNLAERLKSRDPKLRIKALEELSISGSGNVAMQIETFYKKAEDRTEKGEILALLLKKGKKGLAADVKSFRDHPSAELRMRIAYYARFSGDSLLAAEMLAWIKEDKDSLVKEYAARSVGSLGDQKMVPELKKLLESEKPGEFLKKALGKAIEMLDNGATSAADSPLKDANQAASPEK